MHLLEVQQFLDTGMSIDVVAAADAPQLEPEPIGQALQIREPTLLTESRGRVVRFLRGSTHRQ